MEPQQFHIPPRGRQYDKAPSAELSPNSSSTTRLTPESDSDDSDLEMEELGEAYKLQDRAEATESAVFEDGNEDEEEDDEKNRTPRRRGTSVSTVQSYQL